MVTLRPISSTGPTNFKFFERIVITKYGLVLSCTEAQAGLSYHLPTSCIQYYQDHGQQKVKFINVKWKLLQEALKSQLNIKRQTPDMYGTLTMYL